MEHNLDHHKTTLTSLSHDAYVPNSEWSSKRGDCVVRLILTVVSLAVFLLAILLLARGICLPPGQYELVFTNATDRVVSEAIIEIRNSKRILSNVAPQTATTLVFKVSSDTSYNINMRFEGQESVRTNVGYLCRGVVARDQIVVKNDYTLSYSHFNRTITREAANKNTETTRNLCIRQRGQTAAGGIGVAPENSK